MKFPLVTLYNWYRKLIRNPQTRWWVVLGTIVYLISPLDFSPDLFPIAGQIDDFLLITLLLSELFQVALTPSDKTDQAEFNSSTANTAAKPQGTVQDTIDVESVTIED